MQTSFHACSKSVGNGRIDLSTNSNLSISTDWRLSITNITYYWQIEGYDRRDFYQLLVGLDPAGYDLNSDNTPEWPVFSNSDWTNDGPVGNEEGVPSTQDTPAIAVMNTQQPHLTSILHPPQTKAHWVVVGLENAAGTGCSKATGLYNKHRKYSELWNARHPFWTTLDF